ncbi:MAG TPA: ubiquinol-cytochrome c reductase iron-sulfur subunit [Kofleriaceae bacterium]|nr:ubiquinol-cytochrome c reductase iron-sulfur subunit [Kofleriaceae bacterium]
MSERRKRPDPLATLWTRRDLLTRSSWVMVAGTLSVGAAGSVRLLFPRVDFAPPTTVVLGKPSEYAVGEVSMRWKKSHGVILVRTDTGFYALRSICTHLGCIPDWRPAEDKFKCPCHGSGFHRDGVNFEGPAPRPLERYKLVLDADGLLVVDTAVRLRSEEGDWDRPEAFVAYPAEGHERT